MNMQKLMQQAQKMERDIQKKQDELEKMSFTGTYEWVEVVLNGKKEMLSCKINQDNISNEDIEMLQDFIVLAVKDAIKKVDEEYNKKMGQYSNMLGGLM